MLRFFIIREKHGIPVDFFDFGKNMGVNYKLQNTNYKQKINQKLLRGRPEASRGGFLEKSPPGKKIKNMQLFGCYNRYLK